MRLGERRKSGVSGATHLQPEMKSTCHAPKTIKMQPKWSNILSKMQQKPSKTHQKYSNNYHNPTKMHHNSSETHQNASKNTKKHTKIHQLAHRSRRPGGLRPPRSPAPEILTLHAQIRKLKATGNIWFRLLDIGVAGGQAVGGWGGNRWVAGVAGWLG